MAEVVVKINDAIAHYGLTAADLGLALTARKTAKVPVAGGGKPASKRLKKGGAKPSARAVKFKDDQGNNLGRHGQATSVVQGRFGFRQDSRGIAGKGLSPATWQRVPSIGGRLLTRSCAGPHRVMAGRMCDMEIDERTDEAMVSDLAPVFAALSRRPIEIQETWRGSQQVG